eukprot:CAMPEP_0179137932 /NCGR_PEP_ID=MMETSP0796-20121207/65836_1 /TAXON_ID=73915 /ORGANISM="Pyrodinium bahamense, Strain pbaha01" /LENGTH=300 /DNA_ID=CAMNT_0020837161 /DNA_START=21 /DNA_END=923 /DNA_ORIENTATION=+
MSVPRERYPDGHEGGFLEDQGGGMINPQVDHPWYQQLPGFGFNDVVVETPLHNVCIALSEETHVALALQAVVLRGKELMSEQGVRYVTVFKQHKCGSLMHAHWQIITTPFVPSSVEAQLIRAARLQGRFGMCVACRVLVGAPLDTGLSRERLVCASDHFVVSVPYACRERFRLYLAPRRHCPDFFDITNEELRDLAGMLKRVLKLYYWKLNDPPFNLALWTRPTRPDAARPRTRWQSRCCLPSWGAAADSRDAHFHWYIGLYPRGKGVPQGFKNATDIAPMRTLPEDDAALMREWLQELK